MSDPEIPAYLDDMVITLTADIVAASKLSAIGLEEYVNRMIRSGMSRDALRTILTRDLIDGGPIFGDFKKNFKSTFKGAVENTFRDALNSDKDLNQSFEWIGISDFKLCNDCRSRINMKPRNWPQWEMIGLPGAGATICGSNCRCWLAPIEDGIDKEIILKSKEK